MSRRPARRERRLLLWSWIRPGTASDDPGGPWAAEALAPLGRRRVDCDVTTRVMTRILLETREARSAAAAPRASRLAWASSALLAFASLVFLGATLFVLVRGGDEGVAQVAELGQSGWRVLAVFGRVLSEAAGRGLGLVLPLARAVLACIDVSAPLLRGAGLLAAAGGAFAIVLSTYVFASARKTAPRATFHGGLR